MDQISGADIRPETGEDAEGIRKVLDSACGGPGEARLVDVRRRAGPVLVPATHALTGEFPAPAKASQGLALSPGALAGIRGIVRYPRPFHDL